MLTVEKRRKIERRIASRLIRDGLAAGYTIGVYNGEEHVLKKSTSRKAILAAMFSVDDEHLIFYNKDGLRVGWVWFVYGNDGWDVINDYTTSLESVMSGVNQFADSLS